MSLTKKQLHKTCINLALLTVAAAFAFAANFAYGQWTNPTADPVGGNIAPPINTSNNNQTKLGALGVRGLSVYNADQLISSQLPRLRLHDSNGPVEWRMQADNGRVYFLDVLPDQAAYPWGASNLPPLVLQSEIDGGQDWARFAGEVRAERYCDLNGQNCLENGTGPVSPNPDYYFSVACRNTDDCFRQGDLICSHNHGTDAVEIDRVEIDFGEREGWNYVFSCSGSTPPGSTVVTLSRSEIESLLRPQIEADLGGGTRIDGIYARGDEGLRACRAYGTRTGVIGEVTLAGQDDGDFNEPQDNTMTFLNPSGNWETTDAGRIQCVTEQVCTGDGCSDETRCYPASYGHPYIQGQTINRFLRSVDCSIPPQPVS